MCRDNCFWYTPWKDMAATINQCYLAEMGECPCDDDCEWFITSGDARAAVYQLLLEEKEKREALVSFGF